jgi:hypothetical protein
MIVFAPLLIGDEPQERLARGCGELWARTMQAGRRLFAAEPDPVP